MELSRSKHLFSTYLVWFDYIEVKSLIYMVIPWPLTCCNYRHRPCIIIISIAHCKYLHCPIFTIVYMFTKGDALLHVNIRSIYHGHKIHQLNVLDLISARPIYMISDDTWMILT